MLKDNMQYLCIREISPNFIKDEVYSLLSDCTMFAGGSRVNISDEELAQCFIKVEAHHFDTYSVVYKQLGNPVAHFTISGRSMEISLGDIPEENHTSLVKEIYIRVSKIVLDSKA